MNPNISTISRNLREIDGQPVTYLAYLISPIWDPELELGLSSATQPGSLALTLHCPPPGVAHSRMTSMMQKTKLPSQANSDASRRSDFQSYPEWSFHTCNKG